MALKYISETTFNTTAQGGIKQKAFAQDVQEFIKQ